ncbi:hypothetical protein NKR23_g11541 [Pleurostoma richardsiae]|uniref:Uncharacterized protein n=1 Tax=Pleurostoma richardsiae TaxID=41990 RepID=A0AA38VBD7_9PEZI|nr:hypothetical protein NKR23_g11541 [Pleurostoma richardsiae]
MRIGTLTRKAYHCGLNQIDSVNNLMSFGWNLLALPSNYMRHTRDVMSGESAVDYNSRLQTLLKFHSIRLLLRLPSRRLDALNWLALWQENLEICYRIFEIIQQWDMQATLTVDPAVCFIALSILILLHLHSQSNGISNPTLVSQLSRRKTVIRLFLQRYANHWVLPRFLLVSFDTFVLKVSEPLQPEDICHIMDHFHGPLHQKWLNFLSPFQFD